jgi:aryl-alcohol dehydrogenase-like predicted oxidoreductase
MSEEDAVKKGRIAAIGESIAGWNKDDLAQLHALAQAANALQGRRQPEWNLLDFAVEVLLPALGAA